VLCLFGMKHHSPESLPSSSRHNELQVGRSLHPRCLRCLTLSCTIAYFRTSVSLLDRQPTRGPCGDLRESDKINLFVLHHTYRAQSNAITEWALGHLIATNTSSYLALAYCNNTYECDCLNHKPKWSVNNTTSDI
jgi:hypothetical protein